MNVLLPALLLLAPAGPQPEKPVSFVHDVLPVLTRQGCNVAACHGSPTGKGGFRLSLRGYDPAPRSTDPAARSAGPARQPLTARGEPDAAQATGPGPPRGRPETASRRYVPAHPRTLDRRGLPDDLNAPPACASKCRPASKPSPGPEGAAARRAGPHYADRTSRASRTWPTTERG